ncbi:MAG: hypothetical protein RLZZ380_531 [Actinomycetota bacterium]|jgi:uncharacterized membrane protein YeiH
MQNDFANQTLQILEIIGTVAFGASGLIAAARKKLDMVGVVLLVLVTAFGGGTLRDILLDRHPFFWMQNEIWIWLLAALAIGTQFLVKARNVELSAKAIDWPDAIGLGVFAASGTQIALTAGHSALIASIMGVITAAFGGLIRDVLVAEIPGLVNDHQLYASLAFVGGLFIWLLEYLKVDSTIATLTGAITIIVIRIIAMRLGWKLPAWRS